MISFESHVSASCGEIRCVGAGTCAGLSLVRTASNIEPASLHPRHRPQTWAGLDRTWVTRLPQMARRCKGVKCRLVGTGWHYRKVGHLQWRCFGLGPIISTIRKGAISIDTVSPVPQSTVDPGAWSNPLIPDRNPFLSCNGKVLAPQSCRSRWSLWSRSRATR